MSFHGELGRRRSVWRVVNRFRFFKSWDRPGLSFGVDNSGEAVDMLKGGGVFCVEVILVM